MEPPNKKTKIENDITKAIDAYIKILRQCKNLKAILGDEYLETSPMIKVYVGHVKDTKLLSKAILALNEKVPLKDLNYLKRVRNRDVLLCPSHYLNSAASIQDYLETNVPEIKDIFKYFKEVELPATAPKLKRQLLPTWSFNFHPNKYLELLATNEFFNPKEMALNILFMEVCFEVAKFYLQMEEDSVSPDFIQQINATVIVDPLINSVVAVGFFKNNHPVYHSTMLAIDNVAKTQYGGAWGNTSQKLSTCHQSGIEKNLLTYLMKACPRVRFGARTYQKRSEDRQKTLEGGQKMDVCEETVNDGQETMKDGQNLSEIGQKETEVGQKIENEDKNTLEGQTNNGNADKKPADQQTVKKGPYLCTDYYVYTIREPCIMCSMALVHARAKRIFFCFDNQYAGGLNSRIKLQTVASLNHHFEVFTGFLNCETSS